MFNRVFKPLAEFRIVDFFWCGTYDNAFMGMMLVPKVLILAGAISLGALNVSAEPIHVAARKGNTEDLVRMIAKGTAVDLPSTRDTSVSGISPLIVAIKWGNKDVVEVLLSAGADVDFNSSKTYASTPAMVAVTYGRHNILELLLNKGVDVDSVTGDGSLLHIARRVRRSDIANLLVERGATLSITAPSIEPLLAAADLDRGRLMFAQCRECHSGDNDVGRTMKAGVHLWNVVGRDVASLPDAEYSEALIAFDGAWTYNSLNSFLANPGAFVPGTSETGFAPIKSAKDRADIIIFLRSLSNDPIPLP